MNLRDETIMKIAAAEAQGEDVMPSPPYPPPHDPALKVVVDRAILMLSEGHRPEEAIIYAAVHGWYEGHLHAVDGPVDPAVFRT